MGGLLRLGSQCRALRHPARGGHRPRHSPRHPRRCAADPLRRRGRQPYDRRGRAGVGRARGAGRWGGGTPRADVRRAPAWARRRRGGPAAVSSVTRLATRGLGRPIWPVTQWLLEPGDSSPAQGRPAGVDERLRRRIWIVVCCLLLTVLALLTRPGRIIADTKLDMAINPGEFLDRALHLWDPAQFGQLQDQVAGYFFPMGPFFWLWHAAPLHPWAVQWLWRAPGPIAAFVGTTRVAARLRVGAPMTHVVACLG